MRRVSLIWALALGGLALGLAGCSRAPREQRAVQEVLAAAGLAPLPASATEIRTYGWTGLLQGEAYIMFRAAQPDIAKFVAGSPCLLGVQPKTYGPDHQRLPLPEDFFKNTEKYTQSGHEFNERSNPRVEWYPFKIDFPASRYEIYPSGGQDWGELILDETTGTVYVQVVWN
jgi:hypothetical protein